MVLVLEGVLQASPLNEILGQLFLTLALKTELGSFLIQQDAGTP